MFINSTKKFIGIGKKVMEPLMFHSTISNSTAVEIIMTTKLKNLPAIKLIETSSMGNKTNKQKNDEKGVFGDFNRMISCFLPIVDHQTKLNSQEVHLCIIKFFQKCNKWTLKKTQKELQELKQTTNYVDFVCWMAFFFLRFLNETTRDNFIKFLSEEIVTNRNDSFVKFDVLNAFLALKEHELPQLNFLNELSKIFYLKDDFEAGIKIWYKDASLKYCLNAFVIIHKHNYSTEVANKIFFILNNLINFSHQHSYYLLVIQDLFKFSFDKLSDESKLYLFGICFNKSINLTALLSMDLNLLLNKCEQTFVNYNSTENCNNLVSSARKPADFENNHEKAKECLLKSFHLILMKMIKNDRIQNLNLEYLYFVTGEINFFEPKNQFAKELVSVLASVNQNNNLYVLNFILLNRIDNFDKIKQFPDGETLIKQLLDKNDWFYEKNHLFFILSIWRTYYLLSQNEENWKKIEKTKQLIASKEFLKLLNVTYEPVLNNLENFSNWFALNFLQIKPDKIINNTSFYQINRIRMQVFRNFVRNSINKDILEFENFLEKYLACAHDDIEDDLDDLKEIILMINQNESNDLSLEYQKVFKQSLQKIIDTSKDLMTENTDYILEIEKLLSLIRVKKIE